jgi:hypothetical protein
MTNQLSHANLFSDLSNVTLRRVFNTDQGWIMEAHGQNSAVCPSCQSSCLCLITRWTDQNSFRRWHFELSSPAHHQSPRGMPKGLRLDPAFTRIFVLERLTDAARPRSMSEIVVDSQTLMTDVELRPTGLPARSLRFIRNKKRKCGSRAFVSNCPQTTVMTLDDRATDRKPHSHTVRLRGVEGFEEPVDTLRI